MKNSSKNKIKDDALIEFVTNNGVGIKMVKRNNKYYILVSDDKKRMKSRKVFESLDTNLSTNQFFKFCTFFTKEINK